VSGIGRGKIGAGIGIWTRRRKMEWRKEIRKGDAREKVC
jgi:hypothetical protein